MLLKAKNDYSRSPEMLERRRAKENAENKAIRQYEIDKNIAKVLELKDKDLLVQAVGQVVFIFALNSQARYEFQGVGIVGPGSSAEHRPNVDWVEKPLA